MATIRNPHLLRAIVQRTFRGVAPPPAITAPMPIVGIKSITDERDRLAQFQMSAATRNGRVPNPPVRHDHALVPLDQLVGALPRTRVPCTAGELVTPSNCQAVSGE